jgi:hypothetical protein
MSEVVVQDKKIAHNTWLILKYQLFIAISFNVVSLTVHGFNAVTLMQSQSLHTGEETKYFNSIYFFCRSQAHMWGGKVFQLHFYFFLSITSTQARRQSISTPFLFFLSITSTQARRQSISTPFIFSVNQTSTHARRQIISTPFIFSVSHKHTGKEAKYFNSIFNFSDVSNS